jgi:hypothetical protein
MARIVYYHDDAVEVTSAGINIRNRQFALSELEYVWHQQAAASVRARHEFAHRSLINVGLIAGAVLATFGVIYLIISAFGDASPAVEVLLPLAAVVILLAFAGPILEWALHRLDHSYDLGSNIQEIWVRWRGKNILLLRIADDLKFGQIYRSIERAIEQQSQP